MMPTPRDRGTGRNAAAKRWTLCAAAALLLACLPPLVGPVAAQDHLFSITGYLGSAGYSDLAEGGDPGVMLDPSAFYGVQAEFWFGRFGARLHTGFADTQLEPAPDSGFAILAIDADFLARLRRPRPGQIFQPYGVLGFGVVRYSTGTDATTLAGYDYGRDPENRASMVLGIGADFGSGPAAVRLELMDIIGFSSPLTGPDGSNFGPVSHVVLTLGLSFRIGRIDLPEPGRTEPTRLAPTRPRPTRPVDAGRADTVATDTVPVDTIVDTVPVDTVATDTVPVDTAVTAVPTDTPAQDTIRTPILPPRPERPPRDTAAEPDTAGPRGPVVHQPPDTTRVTIPVDTGGPDETPPDTVDAPADTTDTGRTRGRLFAVRVAWDPGDAVQATAAASLLAVLDEADVPNRASPAGDDDDPTLSYRRAAALRDAAHARILANHIEAEYSLAAEWVHIGRDEEVAPEAVEASMSFVETLSQGPGQEGRGGSRGADGADGAGESGGSGGPGGPGESGESGESGGPGAVGGPGAAGGPDRDRGGGS